MLVRRAAAAVLLSTLLTGGAAACSSGSGESAAPGTTAAGSTSAPGSPAPSSTAPGSAAPGSAAATPAGACGQLTQGLANARQVVATAGAKPVLRPSLALVLLSLRDEALRGSAVAAPVGPALTELVAAIDDVDTQAGVALPAGADPAATPVTVDPARLSAAVDGAESACGSVG